jgi:hypothetical protein
LLALKKATAEDDTMKRCELHAQKYRVVLTILSALLNLSPFATAQPHTILPKLPPVVNTTEYTVTENDSTKYEIKLAFGRSRLPEFFFRNVFTPVCYTGVCKPVHIDMYWDLLGNYLGFQVPASEPLTKTDHKEFLEEDYLKLHKILANTQSLLEDFTIYELVDHRTYNLSDSVDAVTGATPKTIQKEVIAGAVFTCYTLWHIVNGPVVQSMRNITKSISNDALLKSFLKSNNHSYQYWAIDEAVSSKRTLSAEFFPLITRIVEADNIFTARYALEKIPSQIFSGNDSLQAWLWTVYKKSHYSLQLAILDKLRTVEVPDSIIDLLALELANANEEQFGRIIKLLASPNLPASAISKLGSYLHSSDTARAEAVYKVLSANDVKDNEVKKQMKRLAKSNPRLNR